MLDLFIVFLSTLSLRRATAYCQGPFVLQTFFYPRSPCGERQFWEGIKDGQSNFSIHALLAESDHPKMSNHPHNTSFLSTLSLRRATTHDFTTLHNILFSIHALLAESDSKSAQNSGALLRIWNKFYGDCIFMLTGKAVFYPFCPCFFHIFWCEGTGNFMIAFPSH